MLSPIATGIYAGAGAASGIGLLLGGWAYASRDPRSRLFGRALTAPHKPGEIVLTFDDGPNPAWTPRLLDTLAAHRVQATFFLLGRFAQGQPDLVRRIAAQGHLIGNHSWSHPDLSRKPARTIRDELERTSTTLEQITGAAVRYFRPPFGARRPVVFRIARELGLAPVLWNAMTSDWSEPSPERIAARLIRKVDWFTRSGSAVNLVLHDGNYRESSANRGPSVNAAATLLSQFAPTHRFVRLDAWADTWAHA
jgi:peptidoglycan-N-acetylglucosamine deacetylase